MLEINVLFHPKQNQLVHGELPHEVVDGKNMELLLWREDAEAWKLTEPALRKEVFEFSGRNMESVKEIAARVLRNRLEPVHLEELFQTL